MNGDAVKLPSSIFDFVKKHGAIVDSGTTLAYFPDEVFKQIMEKVCEAPFASLLNLVFLYLWIFFTFYNPQGFPFDIDHGCTTR